MTRLRPARPDDAPACAAVLGEWIAETAWFPNLHSPAEDVGFVARKIENGQVMVADVSGVAGFLALDDDYVSCLYVARAARGQGLGKDLLSHAKSQRRCLSLWTFQANLGAQKFYLREGFAEAQRTDGADNEEQLPDIEYTWAKGVGA